MRLSEIYLQVPVLMRPSAHVLRISCGPPMCALDLRQHTHLPVRALGMQQSLTSTCSEKDS